MKKDILFANGCSFTWGGALEPWFMFVAGKPLGDIIGYDAKDFMTAKGFTGKENSAVREQLLWPHHLGNLLGCHDVVNLGMGCGSNQRIIRTTLDWLSAQDRETLDRTKAVIQLTEPSRYEYYDQENDFWARCKIDVCTQKGEDQEIAQERNMSRLSTFTKLEGIYNFVSDCMAINQIMTSFDVEYHMWCLVNPFDRTDPDFMHLKDLINKSCSWINQTMLESLYGSLETLKADNGKISTAPSSNHPGVEGHQELAEILHFYMLAKS